MAKAHWLLPLIGTAALALAIGCSSDPASAGGGSTTGGGTGAPEAPTAAMVEEVINTRCMPCHGGSTPKEELNLTSVAGLLKGSEHGPVVTPGDAANSKVVHALRGTGGMKKMPPAKAPQPTEEQIKIIEDWINAGAAPN